MLLEAWEAIRSIIIIILGLLTTMEAMLLTVFFNKIITILYLATQTTSFQAPPTA